MQYAKPQKRKHYISLYKIHASLHTAFANGNGKLSSIQFRKNQLLQLGYAFQDNVEKWQDALEKDMNRPKFESSMCVFSLSCFMTRKSHWIAGLTYLQC